MLGIRVARLPRRIKNETVTLRLSRYRDLSILSALFTPGLILQMNGQRNRLAPKAFRSLFSFSRWLRTTFQLVYIIEVPRSAGARIVGFIGCYDMEIGQSLCLSVAIFHLGDRQRGYGHQALELLLRDLQKNSIVETVCMEVLSTNLPSLSLCHKLGFAVRRHSETTTFLERQLSVQPQIEK